MYKVYILDDEPMILEGLRYIIPWEDYGFEIVGSARNGEEGYNDIINLELDLILSDIMMPKMTGLELIEKLKNINYNSKFMVMSAFQEFEYAKKAINMGAENYLLKPLDVDELLNNIKKIHKILDSEKNQQKDNKLIKYKKLLDIFKDSSNKNVEEKLLSLGINTNLKKENLYSVVIEMKNTNENIENVLIEKSNEYGFVFCMESYNKAILLLSTQNDEIDIDMLTDIKNSILNKEDDTLYISIGKKVNKLYEISSSYETAKEVSEFKIVYPNISWIKEYKQCDNESKGINVDTDRLRKILKDKNYSEIIISVQNIFTNIKGEDLTPKQIRVKSIEVFLYVYNYFGEAKIIKGLNEYLERVINKETVDEIEEEAINMIKFMQSKLENTEESISPVIIKLLKHIEENYKKDLNLKEISEKLNINAIYLGQLFQRETGILFSDYINNFRINRAKDLLINTSLKASEIGDLIGYSNKNYFYRKFKDLVGITPSEWRKINL